MNDSNKKLKEDLNPGEGEVNVKTSVFRKIGSRRLNDTQIRQLYFDDSALLEMICGIMTDTEFMEIASVLKHYKEQSDKRNLDQ